MAKKAFNLGDYLKSEGPVSTLDTEQIVRIPLEDIVPDPRNFYSMTGIEDLAGNIELIGLQQPLRVRPAASSEHVARDPARRDDGMRFIVVSGHRRLEAIKRIREDNPDAFPLGVPCLVDYGEASEAMRELRLIYANSDTRDMTAAEKSKQTERVEEILYQLKEQGVEFPGRMRDHVAEACRISASKYARLHAIRENLIDAYRLAWDAGKLSETSAYRLSQESEPNQRKIFDRVGLTPCTVTTADLDKVIEQVKRPAETATSSAAAAAPSPQGEGGVAEIRDTVSGYLEQRAQEDEEYYDALQHVADRFLCSLAHLESRQHGIEQLKQNFKHCGHAGGAVDWQGTPKGLILNDLSEHPILRTWTDAFDMLCRIALDRAAQALFEPEDDEDSEARSTSHANPRVAMDEEEAESRMDTNLGWKTGTPQRNGRYYCRILFADSPEDGGRVHEQRGEWRDGGWWFFGEPEKYGIQVVGWWPLPDEERWS